ncbi:hypothetical protein C8R48DRAFT_538789, partial [Suillus tomentosus]
HGMELIFPFDLVEGTFLVALPGQSEFTTTDLIAWRAHQLQKRQEDLNDIKKKVLKARYKSIRNFEEYFHDSIKDYDFDPGALVLVCNSRIEYELNQKTKLRYLGPMVVLHCTKGGSYVLVEVNGSVSKLHYAAFHLIPYFLRSETKLSVPQI